MATRVVPDDPDKWNRRSDKHSWRTFWLGIAGLVLTAIAAIMVPIIDEQSAPVEEDPLQKCLREHKIEEREPLGVGIHRMSRFTAAVKRRPPTRHTPGE